MYLKFRFCVLLLGIYLSVTRAKDDNKISLNNSQTTLPLKPAGGGGAALLFADELKQTLEKYLFGICPQTFKMQFNKSRNITTAASACDLDSEQQDLAGRLAALSLRAHSASRSECLRLGTLLANTLGELAQTAANRQSILATSAETKKRKLSKSQKLKIQAKQRTALAVKKKAAAVAAAAAAKIAS